MRKLIFGLASVGALMVAIPAQSQVYVDPGRGGVAIGVDRDHGWRWRHRHSFDACRVVRERIETPSGRVIYRTRREC